MRCCCCSARKGMFLYRHGLTCGGELVQNNFRSCGYSLNALGVQPKRFLNDRLNVERSLKPHL